MFCREESRLVSIALFTFFLFSLLIAQYFKIQILEHEKWSQEALKQHEYIATEPFRRGLFYSNTALKAGHPEAPQPFVMDVIKFHLYVDPLAIPKAVRPVLIGELARWGIDSKRAAEALEKRSRSRQVGEWLEGREREEILTWWNGFARKEKIPKNALYFVTDYQRSYPFGSLLGQVLHTIRDRKEGDQGVPTGGLEAYFNDILKGKPGKWRQGRSPLHTLERGICLEPAEDGMDIYLTINHYIQAVAEEELAKGVALAKAKGGWAVMMDPHTGEILALAQFPAFDPRRYREVFNDPTRCEEAKVKAVTDAFELGSIMKPITLAVCLEANRLLAARGEGALFQPLDKVPTTEGNFPGRARKPLKDTSLHHYLNMYMALQKSSNIYMARMVDRAIHRLSNGWYRAMLAECFGFGKKTGIELPGEAAGLLPTPGRRHPNGSAEWSLPTPYSLAIGYNMLATSVQMVRAYAVLANGGWLVEPTLVRKIVQAKEPVVVREHLSQAKRVLSPEVVAEVVRAMKFTTKPGGTAAKADIPGYSEAGKTGTAEKIVDGVYSKQRYISSFVGFAPAQCHRPEEARLVLLVSIEEPAVGYVPGVGKNHHGGNCAAPVFREIARRTLEYLGVAPDDPDSLPGGVADRADWVQEVKQLRQLYAEWNPKK